MMQENCSHGVSFKERCSSCEMYWAMRMLDQAERLRADTLAELGMQPEKDDMLPALGTSVLIHLSSIDKWVKHTVVGYYVWAGKEVNPAYTRTFVRVVDNHGNFNARLLCDIRYPEKAQ